MPPARAQRILAALPATLFLLCGCPGGLTADPTTDDAAIRGIRQHYAQINAEAAKCRRVKKALWGYSTEGGELVAFLRGDEVVKLGLTFLGESGRAAEEYYYRDGQLIFLYRVDSDYDQPLSGKVVRTRKTRCYFRDSALIAWIDTDGKAVPPGSDRFQDKQKECVQDSGEFVRAARSPEPEIQAAHYR